MAWITEVAEKGLALVSGRYATRLAERAAEKAAAEAGARLAQEEAARIALKVAREAAEKKTADAAKILEARGETVLKDAAGKPVISNAKMADLDKELAATAAKQAAPAVEKAAVEAMPVAAEKIGHWTGRGILTSGNKGMAEKITDVAGNPAYAQKLLDRIKIRGGLKGDELDKVSNLIPRGGESARIAQEAIDINRHYSRMGESFGGSWFKVPLSRAMEFGKYVVRNPGESAWVAGVVTPARVLMWPWKTAVGGLVDMGKSVTPFVKDSPGFIKSAAKSALGVFGIYQESKLLPDGAKDAIAEQGKKHVVEPAKDAAITHVIHPVENKIIDGAQSVLGVIPIVGGMAAQGLETWRPTSLDKRDPSKEPFTKAATTATETTPAADQKTPKGGPSLESMMPNMLKNAGPLALIMAGVGFFAGNDWTSKFVGALIMGAIGMWLESAGFGLGKLFGNSAPKGKEEPPVTAYRPALAPTLAPGGS